MDNQTTTTLPIITAHSENSANSSTIIADTTASTAVATLSHHHHHHHHHSLNSSTIMTTRGPFLHQRRRQQELGGDLQTLLVAEFTDNNNTSSSSNNTSLLHSNKVWSNEELQEAAMLFQDEHLLPPKTRQAESESSIFPITTMILIVIMFALYIHQFKTRQSKKHILLSHRILVQKRAIHKIFLAILSHPPRTVRRQRRRLRRRTSFNHSRRRPYLSYLYGNNNVLEAGQNVHGNVSLRWQLFVYSVKNRCGECLVQTWKALSRGHFSGLPLLLYNAFILWSCRDLEKVVVVAAAAAQHDTIIQNNNSNNNIQPLQYLRLLLALAFLTIGMEFVITHFLLQSSLLSAEAPSSTTDSSDTTAASSSSSSSSLTITATDLTVVNANSDDTYFNHHPYVGIPGPPLSARPEYQTRQQRESAIERKKFWRHSLLYKPMGTMTAITTALLWIHRAHFHHVHVLQYQQAQQQQQQEQQEQDEHEAQGGDSNDAPNGTVINGDHLYPSFNILPLLVNLTSHVNGSPTSATLSLIEYSFAMLLLLLFSRFSHPGWAVLCGCIVGMLWGPVGNSNHYNTHAHEDDDDNNKHNNENTMMGDDVDSEGFLHFIAQPYYGDWLMSLLIFFSLLSLKRTRKWSGWLPFIDFVAWGSSSSSTSSISCSNTTTAANNGGSQQDQQQRQATNLRRSRFMIGSSSNEQEAFGFIDDDDDSRGNDSDEDTDSEATTSSQSHENDDDDDFLVDNRTQVERQSQSFISSNNNASLSDEIDNSNNSGGEIYGRLPALGDFLDDEDDVDGGDLELALRMSLQPQYNNNTPSLSQQQHQV